MPQSNPARDQLTDHDTAAFQLLLARLNDSLAQDLSTPSAGSAEPAGPVPQLSERRSR
ncbi:hypothetical protein [Kitasatospora sp. NPDC094015]|uniref:hypothetical protein n=1 Tax=Kitasatospora sp. NPDC094015 TaxID=3155205 RepID=UPI00332C2CCB